MKYINVRCNDKIQLGKRGEYEAVTVQFDISEWRKLYGNGVVRMIVQRSEDNVPYDKDITVDGSVVSWLVDAVDTSFTGWGQVELLYYVGNTLAKSQTYKFHVIEALGEVGETPDPWESLVDRVEGYAATAEQASETAVSAMTAAQGYAEDARQTGLDAIDAINARAEEVEQHLGEEFADEIESVEDFKANVVKVQPDEPTEQSNRLWVDTDVEEYVIPTYDDFESLVLTQENQPTEEQNRIWVNPNTEEITIPDMSDIADVKNANRTATSGYVWTADASGASWKPSQGGGGGGSDVTKETVKNWGFYEKPTGGVPESDLADSVKQKLNNRGTDVTDATVAGWGYYKKPSNGIPASDLESGVIPPAVTDDHINSLIDSKLAPLETLSAQILEVF